MIWQKEISFDGLDEKVSKWYKEHDFLGNPPIDAQFALDLIFKTLIDDKKHFEYLTTMPESTEQINSIIDCSSKTLCKTYRCIRQLCVCVSCSIIFI